MKLDPKQRTQQYMNRYIKTAPYTEMQKANPIF
jgi:hypothetical protein